MTQVPPGPHLGALQGRFGGTVMLCIDVSGSMDGTPILEAVRGAREFVAEAVAARYQVGVMGPRDLVLAKVAQMKAQDIRFITRGLGPLAAREFGEISSQDASTSTVERVEDLAAGIAGMAASLRPGTGG